MTNQLPQTFGVQNKSFSWTGKAGWCSTPNQLLICSSFSRENGHPLLICSSLSTAQKIIFVDMDRSPPTPAVEPHIHWMHRHLSQSNSSEETIRGSPKPQRSWKRRWSTGWCHHEWVTSGPPPKKGSMMGLGRTLFCIFLPTWMVNFYGFCPRDPITLSEENWGV